MPQWAPFLAVVGILVVVLLLLAHKSQQFLHEHADVSGSERRSACDNDSRIGKSSASSSSEERGSETRGVPDAAAEFDADSTARSDTDIAQMVDDSMVGDSVVDDPGGEQALTEADHPAGDGAETEASSSADTDTAIAHGEPSPDDRQGDTPPAREHHGRKVVLTPGVLLANVAFTQALVAAILVGAAWYFSIPASAFGLDGGAVSNTGVALGVGVAFGVALWVGNELSTVLADAVGAAYDETVRQMLAPATTGGWLFLFCGVLPLIAVTEELLFRAALIGVPAAGLGTSVWLLALVSSVAFAFGHGAQGRVGIVVTGILGLALAAGFVLTGSLLVVVVAHYVINALEFLVHEFLGVGSLYGTER